MPRKNKPAPVQTAAVASTAAQPETTPLTVTRNGESVTYKLQLTYQGFVRAEQRSRSLGVKYSLLDTLMWDSPSPEQLQRVLFAALQLHHPDVGYQEAAAIVDLRNFADVHRALADAYIHAVEAEA